MTLEELKALKIGLVLGGGGAKGAYQIGCWKALRARGLSRFSALSGTSVGALNAILIALDKPQQAESLWSGMTPRTVVGIRPLALLLFPVWVLLVAYRAMYPPLQSGSGRKLASMREVTLWAVAFCLFAFPPLFLTSQDSGAEWLAALFALALFTPAIRWVILHLGSTTNNPLKQRIVSMVTEHDLRGLRIPVYATLSRFRPDLSILESHWHGWIPDYVRVDALKGDDLREVLLQSAGLPGIFPVRKVLGLEAIDGGWCDNVPLAPLYCDPACEVDLALVIYLGEDERYDTMISFPFGRVSNPAGGVLDGKGRLLIDSQARQHWDAALRANEPARLDVDFQMTYLSNGDDDAYQDSEKGNGPGFVPPAKTPPSFAILTPSEPLGNFLSGTLNFSAPKANYLMDLGKRDMDRFIDRLLEPGVRISKGRLILESAVR